MTSGRSLRVGEAVLGGGLLLLGLFISLQTMALRVAPSQAAVGPRVFPMLVAAGLLVIGALLLREALLGRVAHGQGFSLDWRAAGIVAVALLLTPWLIEPLGWIPAAALLFALTAIAFASRRWLRELLIGLGLSAVAFLVFGYGLDLGLPVGTVAEPVLERLGLI